MLITSGKFIVYSYRLDLKICKAKKQLRVPTGAKIVLIGGGVGSGKLLVWDHIE